VRRFRPDCGYFADAALSKSFRYSP
jgi:hypothetical protein